MTTDKADIGGVESRDHRITHLRQVTNQIIDMIRRLDTKDMNDFAAICDLQHAMQRIDAALNHIKAGREA